MGKTTFRRSLVQRNLKYLLSRAMIITKLQSKLSDRATDPLIIPFKHTMNIKDISNHLGNNKDDQNQGCQSSQHIILPTKHYILLEKLIEIMEIKFKEGIKC
ncbi:hypothetical protein AAHE18_18G242900 [Arachis hypogaea]